MKQNLTIILLACLLLSACAFPAVETASAATLPSEGQKTPQALQPTPVANALFLVVRADGSSQGFNWKGLQELPLATIEIEGKVEEGPELIDVINAAGVTDFSEVTLTGSNGFITLPFEQVDGNTLLDFTNRGTVKLASTYVPKAEWIKDITEIKSEMIRTLIGVDDTDNLESRGTGYRIRQMAVTIESAGLAQAQGITRHQLLVSPEIPYTSHNSSACLVVECDESHAQALWEFCSGFLQRESAPGSDAGLCLTAWDSVSKEVQTFAQRAKHEVLTLAEVELFAKQSDLRLAGLTGTGLGVIGALAAVGLRAAGNDGRFLWLPGLRELNGVYTVTQLQQMAHIDTVCTVEGNMLSSDVQVDVGDWVRPILRNGQSILLVEEYGKHEWRILAKENIKSQSE